jgi:hypothetical protein
VGYAPEGNKRFYSTGFNTNLTTTVTGFAGNNNANSNFAAANSPYTCTANTANLGDGTDTTDPQNFDARASGCIRNGGATVDTWQMDEDKILQNVTVGL